MSIYVPRGVDPQDIAAAMNIAHSFCAAEIERLRAEVKRLKADRDSAEREINEQALSSAGEIQRLERHLASAVQAKQAARDQVTKLQDAIDAEPELPGGMPDEMWAAIGNDRDAVEEALRIAVRQTKANIRAALNPPRPARQLSGTAAESEQ